jgi:hypothetical protein
LLSAQIDDIGDAAYEARLQLDREPSDGIFGTRVVTPSRVGVRHGNRRYRENYDGGCESGGA